MTTLPPSKPLEAGKILNGKRILSGALGLAAALAWNDAIKAAVDAVFPGNKKGSLKALFVYALAVTLIVIGMIAVANAAARHSETVSQAAKSVLKFGSIAPPGRLPAAA